MTKIAKQYQDGAITIFTKSKAPLDKKTADSLIYLILNAASMATRPTRQQVALDLGIRAERLTRLIKVLRIEAEFKRIQTESRGKTLNEVWGDLW